MHPCICDANRESCYKWSRGGVNVRDVDARAGGACAEVKTKRDVIAPNRYGDSDELGERKCKGKNRVKRELGKFTLWREWASESN
jgi:hypothetical protein